MSCIFCRIARGEVPSLKVYEDDSTLVIMDAARDMDGHMLVMPKAHAASLFDCDPATLACLTATIQRVSRHCVEQCGYEGVNLLHASGQSAGQSVPHLHFHLLPRKSGDGVDSWPHLDGAKEDRQTVFDRLRMD